jgi:hypothetical protein
MLPRGASRVIRQDFFGRVGRSPRNFLGIFASSNFEGWQIGRCTGAPYFPFGPGRHRPGGASRGRQPLASIDPARRPHLSPIHAFAHRRARLVAIRFIAAWPITRAAPPFQP